MVGMYGQLSKIHDAGGRQDYLTNGTRQEEVVLHEVHMHYDWEFYSQYEQAHTQKGQLFKNHEALEINFWLDNSLYGNNELISKIANAAALALLGPNRDYEFAVHWNHDRTNLHIHIMFSEREVVLNREPKLYAKDIWQDKDTHKLAKAHAENAELVHCKGEVQKDKDGNIKYKDEPLTAKDVQFKHIHYPQKKNEIIAGVLKEFGYEYRVQTKDSPFLSQKKLYKGASDDYIEQAKAYNAAVKDYNAAVEQHIILKPEMEDTYCDIRKDIETKIKEENRAHRITVHRKGGDITIGSISKGAIEAIKEMAAFVKDQVKILTAKIKSKVAESVVGEWWQANGKELLQKFGDIDERVKTADKKIETATEKFKNEQSLDKAGQKLSRKQKEIKPDIDKGHGGISI